MNDVMPVIEMGCTAFLKVAIGVTLLSFARAALNLMPKKPVVQTTITATSGGPSVAAIVRQEPDLNKRMEEIVQALKKPEPQPEELIECGACHKIIKSAPIAVTDDFETYQCEHCRAQVQVPI